MPFGFGLRIPPIDAERIDAIAAILGDPDTGLTDNQIVSFLLLSDMGEADPKKSKKDRLREAFIRGQERFGTAERVFKFIESVFRAVVLDNVKGLWREPVSQVLLSCGFRFDDDGNIQSCPDDRIGDPVTAIAIENFKGVGERIELEFRPITLLFGANSAGKSTILHALLYAREIFERRNLNADETISGGKYVNFGGFAQFVHRHDIDRRIKLSFRLNLRDWDFIVQTFQRELPDDVTLADLQPLAFYPSDGEVTLEIGWSRGLQSPYIAVFSVTVDGNLLATFSYEPGRKEVRLRVDLANPIFSREAPRRTWFDIEPEEGEAAIEYHWRIAVINQLLPAMDASGVSMDTGGDALPDFDHKLSVGRFAEVETDPNDPDSDRNSEGAVDDQIWNSYQQIVEPIEQCLSNLILGPCALIRYWFTTTRYLGPLRETPERNYSPPHFADPSRWSSGLGAWDSLQNGGEKFVEDISDWLGDADKLNSGYRVAFRRYKEVDLADPLIVQLLTGRAFDEADTDTRVALDSLPTHSRLVILPEGSDLELRPHDVGIGISQVVPVVVTALDGEEHLLAIEQPELHLHPKLQAELGDLFIEAALGDRQHLVILETHSEHLILRLLRRIRETTDGELPEGKHPLRPDDIAVYFVQGTAEGVKATRLRVDETGEFVDQWPEGFFEERAKELF